MSAILVSDRAEEYFISPSKGRRSFEEVIDDIVTFVSEDHESRYSVVVGTDSEQHRDAAEFVSVVTVHRIGKHGRYFWKRMPPIKAYNHHDRMLKEATFSLDLAQRVVAALRERVSEHLYNFEIHLDIGHNGPTKPMISELVGMITGNGFVARSKPESYAANKVADGHVG